MKLLDLLNQFKLTKVNQTWYHPNPNISLLMEYGGNGLIDGVKEGGSCEVWLTPEGIAVRDLLQKMENEKPHQGMITAKRIVGWGNMGGDDKCLMCGEIASIIVEIEGCCEPQPMCSKCVPQDVKDGIMDVFEKILVWGN